MINDQLHLSISIEKGFEQISNLINNELSLIEKNFIDNNLKISKIKSINYLEDLDLEQTQLNEILEIKDLNNLLNFLKNNSIQEHFSPKTYQKNFTILSLLQQSIFLIDQSPLLIFEWIEASLLDLDLSDKYLLLFLPIILNQIKEKIEFHSLKEFKSLNYIINSILLELK